MRPTIPACVLAAFIVDCGGQGEQAGKPAQRPSVPVRVAEAARKDVPRMLSAVGSVEPEATVSVRPLVTGQIVEVYFRDGDEVKDGQRLFQIDPAPYRAALEQARANLARSRRQAENAEADVQRYEPLRKSGYVSPQQFDTAVATARALRSDTAAQAAAVEKAELDLSRCVVTAPIGGRTGAVLVQRGNVVEANQSAPLVVISRLRPVNVAFSVPGQYVGALRQGLGRMRVDADAGRNGESRQGTLTFVNNAVDPSAGTILAKASFPNQDEALWPGQFVEVEITLQVDRGAVVVPSAAVVTGQSGSLVYVVKADQTVEQRTVQVARSDAALAVIARGVEPGETVVTDGQLNLTPGVRVTPRAGQAAPALQTGSGGRDEGAAVAQDGKGNGGAARDGDAARPMQSVGQP